MAELSLKTLLSNIPYYTNDSIIITEAEPIDEPGPVILFVNPTFTRVTGYHPSEVIGKNPRLLQGPDTSRSTTSEIRQALAAWRPITTELLNYKKDGAPFWNELSIFPAADDKGIYRYWISIQRDTTDLRRHQRDLDLRSLAMDASTNGIAVCEIEGETLKVVYGNKTFKTLLGGRADALGAAFLKLLDPTRRKAVTAALQAAVDLGDVHVSEGPMATPAGGSIFARISIEPIPRALNGPRMLLLNVRDKTEEQAQKEEMAQAQRLRAIGQVTGGVAHDFNNLLTIMIHCSEILLEQDGLDADARDLIQTVAQTADRGAALTSQLLSFARRRPLETETIAIRPFLERFEFVLRRLMPSTIDVRFDIAPNLSDLRADPNQLDSALLNLMINARDAIKTYGVIRLVAANKTIEADSGAYQDLGPGDYVSLSVIDDGPGMNDEVLARVFEPFFTTKDVGQGSGLGLSMVYGFARQSEGCASIVSAPGHGTTVEILLPRSHDPRATAATPRHSEKGVAADSVTVLVVDDTAEVLKRVNQLVRAVGCRTYLASNGQEALEVLKDHNDVDLLFTDVVMAGGSSGVQLAKAALELRPDLKILFTSGYSQEDPDVMKALSEGAPLLKKPYRRADLTRALSRVLGPREAPASSRHPTAASE
jgi:PAS domain S-box-containing protein